MSKNEHVKGLLDGINKGGTEMTTPEESLIVTGPGGTAFVGPDATMLFRVLALKVACSAYAKHRMRMNRVYTPTAMLAAATAITGQKYRRGQHMKAALDLEVWCNNMKAALPVVSRGGGPV